MSDGGKLTDPLSFRCQFAVDCPEEREARLAKSLVSAKSLGNIQTISAILFELTPLMQC